MPESINGKSILFIPFPFACNCGKELFRIQKWRTEIRILTQLSKQVFWNWSGWECRVYYAKRKSKRFLHWSSGPDLLAVLKPTPLLPHAKMLPVPIRFFFWRVDHALEGSMLWLSKCDFSRLFPTERSWHAYWFSMVFEFLVSMICPFPASRGLSSWETSASREICPLMQQRFLWPLLRRKALFCG